MENLLNDHLKKKREKKTKGEKKKKNQFARNRWECDYCLSPSGLLKYVQKDILPDVTNFEEKNAGNRMGLRANQIKSLNKKTKTKTINTYFVIKALLVYFHCCPKES